MKPGRVGVDDVDHAAVELGLDLDPEDVDQPRRLVAEQGPGDAAVARLGADGDAQQRVIIALAVVADFGHVEPAFLGQERRVDHVHGLRIGPHQPGQHRPGDRLLVELGRGALDLDRDRADVLADDLPDQPAKLFGERHVGLEPRRFLGGQARHVDRVGDPAEQQEIAHLLGDLDRDIDLRFAGRGAEVRGRDEVGRAEQGRVLGRLGLEHVERRAADLAAVERVLQRRLVDQPAARAIDDPHARAWSWPAPRGSRMPRVWSVSGVWSVMKSARASSVSRSAFSTPISTARSGVRKGSKATTFILSPSARAGDDRADIARADQPQRLAGHLDPHEAVLFPLAGLGRGVGLGQLAGEREHQGDGMLGGGDRIAERGVHHHHAALRWRRGYRHCRPRSRRGRRPSAWSPLSSSLGRDLGRRADRQPVIFADDRRQLVGGLAGDFIDVDPALAEDGGGARVHRVGNEDFELVTWSAPRPNRATARALRYRRCRRSRRTRCAGPAGRRDSRRCRRRRPRPRAAWRSP